MNALARALRGLVGLFVDDGKLAAILVGLLTIVRLLAHFSTLDASLTLALLVGGTVGALLANVIRAAVLTRRYGTSPAPDSARLAKADFT